MGRVGTKRTAWQLRFEELQRAKRAYRALASDQAKAAEAERMSEIGALRERLRNREGAIGKLGPAYRISRDVAGRTVSGKSIPSQIDVVKNRIRKLERYIARCAGPQPQEESLLAKQRADLEAFEHELAEANKEIPTLLARINKLEHQDEAAFLE
jgi:DNA repair exonuclease SbcCD ATPase subunit